MKIGIIGSGMRAFMVLDAINDIEGISCAAIWSRKQDKINTIELEEKYHVRTIHTEIDEFLKDKTFDVVYVAVINHLHYQFAKQALEYGKHVICEKPFTTTVAEAEELVKIAKNKHKLIFESVMLRYSDNYDAVKENIHNLGNMKLIQFNFSQYSRRFDSYKSGIVLPVFDPKYSGGCLYDLTVYCVHFINGIFGYPKEIAYYANKGFNGIDTSGSLILDYGNFKAVCNVAKDSTSPSFCILQGDEGYMKIDSKPGNVKNVAMILRNGESKLLDKTGVSENPLVDVFLKIRKMKHENDYENCYKMIDASVEVMRILENARKYAKITFGVD